MCGIAGIVSLTRDSVLHLERKLALLNRLQAHRGPDGEGSFCASDGRVGLAHKRLSIIDVESGAQPMRHESGLVVVFNGEIYNYVELRQELGIENFRTNSDTEVILQAYLKWGKHCLSRFRGMFAFAIYDPKHDRVLIARDRLGIKPLYLFKDPKSLYFASEVKALLPFLPEITLDPAALKEYLALQLYLEGKTLFKDIFELPPGHFIEIENGSVSQRRYWEAFYQQDFEQSEDLVQEKLRELLEKSVRLHCRSDVPIGAYVSGGIDSSLVSVLASRLVEKPMLCFVGKFTEFPGYDESHHARTVADWMGGTLIERDITADDFINNIERVIYHLDYPVAGPGSFSQFMISETAAKHRKVMLGGQGGDEIFGGYVRYLLAYFEQCILGAIDGTLDKGQFIVTYESIIPNLGSLRNYKPMIQEFWKEGLFESMDRRYYRLVNRASALTNEIEWDALGGDSPFDAYARVFNSSNVHQKAYFDRMQNFDMKTLLPALLHIEDRVSMAHGLESRVPLLDHEIIEFAASVPANIKFKNGKLKRLLIETFRKTLPEPIVQRKDKMGFPTPFNLWAAGRARDFIYDVFHSESCRQRFFFNHDNLLHGLFKDREYGRNLWGLMSLELWCRTFLDRAQEFKQLAAD
jgi:asparagine synthase (glutamine-hydrolysing)